MTSYSYDSAGNLTTIDQPSPRGDESITWDALSRVATYTDGKGQTTSSTYDALDRPLSLSYSGGASITNTYDNAGRLATTTDASGMTSYGYDSLGRLTSESFPGGATNAYTYDPAGNLLTFTDAGGTVTYTYDADNRLATLSEPSGAQTGFAYDADGHLTTTTLPTGTGVTVANTWVDGQLSRVRASKGGVALIDYQYCYRDPASGCSTTPVTGAPSPLLMGLTDAVGGDSTTYAYDAMSRLTDASTAGTHPRVEQVTYDAAGNRATWTANGTTTSYSYNSANQLTQAGGTTYTYDLNGALTSASTGLGLTYNAQHQTSSVTTPGTGTEAMGYRGIGEGRRIFAGANSFGQSRLGVSATTNAGGATFYTRKPDGSPIGQRGLSGDAYYLFDGSDSLSAVLSANGTVVARYAYDSYGAVIRSTGTSDAPWRFGGAMLDASGLYNVGGGYYDPTTGRETQAGTASLSPGQSSGSPVAARLTRSQILDRIIVARDVPLSYFINVLKGSVRYSDLLWRQMIWIDNGCSAPPIIGYGQSYYILFNKACQRHDFGYRNSAMGNFRGETHRATLDSRLASDMNQTCHQVYGYTSAANSCLRVAAQWWEGVRYWGRIE